MNSSNAAVDVIKRFWWMNDPSIRDWMENDFSDAEEKLMSDLFATMDDDE